MINIQTQQPPNTNITPVILAGGQGRRLRPLTSTTRSKALIKFFSRDSFLQRTLKRVPNLNPPIIITEERHIRPLIKQLKEIDITSARIIAEPTGRSTAPALALAAHMAQDEDLLILPCDQAIKYETHFERNISTAAVIPLDDKFLLFGVKPQKSTTRYGYIKARFGNMIIDQVESFHEKPDLETAENYYKDNQYFWNTGIFLTNANHLKNELEYYQPALMQQINQAIHKIETNILYLHNDIYERIKPISIDVALMEKTQSAFVTPLDLPWSDTGTWPSLIASKFGIF